MGERKSALTFSFAMYKEQLLQNSTITLREQEGTLALQHYIDRVFEKDKELEDIRKGHNDALAVLYPFFSEMDSHQWCHLLDDYYPNHTLSCVNTRIGNPVLYLGEAAATHEW